MRAVEAPGSRRVPERDRTRWRRRPRRSARASRSRTLPGIEFRFFDDPDALAAAYRRGDLDAASGLSPAVIGDLASATGSRILRYPGSTLTAVLFNLRPGQHAFATPALRTALLEAIDRPALIQSAFAMAASAAAGLIPSSSVLFDPAAADDRWPTTRRRARRRSRRRAGRRSTTPGDGRTSRSRSPSTCSARTPPPTRPPSPPPRPSPRLEADRPAGHARGAAAGRVRHRPAGQGHLQRGGRGRDGRPRSRPLPAPGLEPDPDRRLERHRPAGSGARQAARRGPQARDGGGPKAAGLFGPPGPAGQGSNTCSRWPSPTSRSWSATRSRDRFRARSPTRRIDFGMC